MKAEIFGKRRSALLWRVLVTVAIFAVIAWWLPLGEVFEAMTRVGWWRWLLVVAVFGAGHVVAAYKWCRLVRAVDRPLNFGEALRAHMAGLFANIWLPSIVGGDVVRAGWISSRHGIVVPTVIGLLDRVIDLLALVLLVVCGTLLVDHPGGWLAWSVLNTVGVFLLLGITAGLIALRWLKPAHLPGSLQAIGVRIAEIGAALYARPGPALWSLALALLVQLVFVGLNYFLGTALGIEVSFAVWLIAWPLAKIVALLPVSLGGLGVREASMAALLAPFAVAGTLAVAEALVWQSVLFGFGILAGTSVLLRGRAVRKTKC